jgi:uncharacterized protein
MLQDVLVIHGGNSFPSQAKYESWLATKKFTRQDLLGNDWKATLGAMLGTGFDVFTPRMPNPQNAVFEEWALWFTKIESLMHPGVILVGHSLGGIFLSKYLATRTLPVPARAALLVAPLFTADGEDSAPSFELPADLSGIGRQAAMVRMYHSRDDQVIPFGHMARYQALMPGLDAVEFDDRGHFNMAEFPEIVADIRRSASEAW